MIDSSALITPSNQYYQFIFAPSFWEQLKQKAEAGNIVILDKVYDEVARMMMAMNLLNYMNGW